jgi:PAS domain S-box-containing protein
MSVPPAYWTVRPLPLPEPAFTRSPAFREAAEDSSDMIAVLDAAGRRLYANAAFERLLRRADFLSGSDAFAHVHPQDRSRARKQFMRVLTERQDRGARYRIVDRRGAVRHIESRSHVIDGGDGQAPRVMVVSREMAAEEIPHSRIACG